MMPPPMAVIVASVMTPNSPSCASTAFDAPIKANVTRPIESQREMIFSIL